MSAPKSDKQVIADSQAMIDVMAMKIVKARWRLAGVEVDNRLVDLAKSRILTEIEPFLEDVASWAVTTAGAPRGHNG